MTAAVLPFPRPRPLDVLVAARAAVAPEAPAILFAEEEVRCGTLSYGELERHANRLAHELRAAGVGPEVRVAVCLDRTPALVVTILAVLKAGGAYVPLDPAYPRERLAFMLGDSGARLVVSDGERLDRLPAAEAPVLCLDGEDERRRIASHPTTAPPAVTSLDNLAYVIYTSGSTGRAKGVAICHRSVLALLDWAEETYSDAEMAGVLAATSVCFDLSVFELFAPLTRGGTVVLAANALELPDLPAAARVTLLNTVPSTLRELLRLGPLPPSVQTVNLAGEALPGRLVELAYGEPGVAAVWNLYGPSEDTTYSTAELVPRGCAEPLIGRPIGGTRAHVVEGELYLGGAGLARGYLGRPARTAAAFLPDPWSGEAGARLYRTGDVVRELADGRLAFVGRRDQQVKLRGFRIELGEVEVALLRHEAVREAVVVVHEESLVAYVVLCRPAELRDFVRRTLPEYMVPSVVVELEEMPLLPNGKVDRKGLTARPLPRERSAAPAASFAAPETEVEEVLAEIWRDLLEVSRVSVFDKFFDLGGHSLLVPQLFARIHDALGVELPLGTLFQAPSLGELALVVEERLLAELEDLDGDAANAAG